MSLGKLLSKIWNFIIFLCHNKLGWNWRGIILSKHILHSFTGWRDSLRRKMEWYPKSQVADKWTKVPVHLNKSSGLANTSYPKLSKGLQQWLACFFSFSFLSPSDSHSLYYFLPSSSHLPIYISYFSIVVINHHGKDKTQKGECICLMVPED